MKTLLRIGLILFPLSCICQTFTLKGKILDVTNQPIPNATVVISKTKYAVSNFDGIYAINTLAKGKYTLNISSLGYKSTIKTITLTANTNLNIYLKDDVEQLDGVTVVSKKKSTLQKQKSLSISSLDIKDIVAQTDIITDEIDKMSGVRIRRSGSIGDNSNVSINGLSGSAVRVYVDGIPLEFLYPRLDLANIPITDLKRIDVYKGVLPVDIGTDALGGGINLITDKSVKNKFRVAYSVGSFNTHLGNASITLTDKNHLFFRNTTGVNYSDNDYDITANVIKKDPKIKGGFIELENQKVRRFHDMYRMQYSNTSVGVTNKKWADYLELSTNYINAYKEYQNNLRITRWAIGQARGTFENSSSILTYKKALFNKKLQLTTISNYGRELTKFIDTSKVRYNWLGEPMALSNSPGEFNSDGALANTTTKSYINRTSLNYTVNQKHKLLLSNIIAHQTREIEDFNITNPKISFVLPKQKITKKILGTSYNGNYFDKKIDFSIAAKYYHYSLSGFESSSKSIITDSRNFWGWNSALKYNIAKDIAIKGSFERGFLIPEINQFAGNATGIVSNAEIQPENSKNYNLGFQLNKTVFKNYDLYLNANGFLRQQENLIFLKPEIPQKFINAQSVDSKGIESEIKLTAFNKFTVTNSVSYINKVFIDFARKGINNDFLIGTVFPNTPSLFYNIQLIWTENNVFNSAIDSRIYCGFNHVDTFNYVLVAQKDTPENSPELYVPKQNRFDAGISLKFFDKQLTTAFNIVNITNAKLYDNFSIPRPRRSINFKLIYQTTKF